MQLDMHSVGNSDYTVHVVLLVWCITIKMITSTIYYGNFLVHCYKYLSDQLQWHNFLKSLFIRFFSKPVLNLQS